jgi:3-keto-5-aminohexanoate cleavage enzyme
MRLPAGKVIITAALNGAIARKKDNPNVPEQPDEIARAAAECYDAGAAIVHIHARDEQGMPCGTREKFAEIMAAVRAGCDEIVVQLSTGGGSNLTIEERVSCLEARPEMASLNMGTLMRQTGPQAGVPFSNFTKDIEAWAAKMKDLGIKPEMECYSHSMFRDVRNLIDKGLVDPPYYVNFVLGMAYQGAVEASPAMLASMHQFLPEGCYFNTTATGAAQLPLTTMGMVMGGAIRVGLEDNIYYSRGVPAQSSAQLVERAVRIAGELNIEPATPDEAREILGVAKRQAPRESETQ